MSSSPGSPQHAISDRDHGAYVLISAYVWASLSIIAASTRFTLAFRRKVKPRLDEITLFIALVRLPSATPTIHSNRHLCNIACDHRRHHLLPCRYRRRSGQTHLRRRQLRPAYLPQGELRPHHCRRVSPSLFLLGFLRCSDFRSHRHRRRKAVQLASLTARGSERFPLLHRPHRHGCRVDSVFAVRLPISVWPAHALGLLTVDLSEPRQGPICRNCT